MRKQILYLHYWWFYGIFSVSYLMLVSCAEHATQQVLSPKGNKDIISSSPLEVDYAIGFSFEYFNNFKLLHIHNHYNEKQDTLSYLLINRDQQAPEKYKDYPIIYTPVKKVVLMSTTQVALFDALESWDVVCGLSSMDYLWNEKLIDRVTSGKIVEVGQGANLNLETIFTLQPDVLIAVGSPKVKNQVYSMIVDAGIPVIYNAEWLEKSILGRAEWIKVAAILLGKEEKCNSFFNNSVRTYDSLKLLTKNVDNKPLIINNIPYRGTWYVSGGNSYMAQLIRDAGGEFPWKGNRDTGSSVVSFEEIYKVGLEADIWLNPGFCHTLDEIIATDARLANFKPFISDKVYANTKRWSPKKGNDYWERGIVLPHLILADFIHIMHPDLLPDHSLYFYKKL